jgi:hypothetical protein
MASGSLYPFARQLGNVAKEMFNVRIYRTAMGSNFGRVDVVVLDEELSPLEVDKYMTAKQAKKDQLRAIDTARRSARTMRGIDERMRRWLRIFDKPDISRKGKRREIDHIARSFHLSPTFIKTYLHRKLLNAQKEESPTLGTVPSIPPQLLSCLNHLSVTRHLRVTRVSSRAKLKQSLLRNGQNPQSWKHPWRAWKQTYGRINNDTTKQFGSTATAMTDLIARTNSILADWKTYMRSENGFALIRIPHPCKTGTFLPKRCVLVPAWVKHTVSPHHYGMIVRFLCEFALEQWPREQLVRMAGLEQDRVRELFLVPNSGIVENPFMSNNLWEMDLMFKKWKMNIVVDEWMRRSAEKRKAASSELV